ncbi:MAG TPA: AraC family transcriptional regulator [Chthoniobacteraceae bacterium]
MKPRRPSAAPQLYDRDLLRRLEDPRVLLALFDDLPRTYLFVKDRCHRFVKVNRGLLALHGCGAEEEMLGKTDLDFHPPAMASQYIEEDRRVMETRRPLVNQAWLVRGVDGLPRWYLSTKLPMFDASGKILGIAGVMRPFDHASDAPGAYQRITPALEFVLGSFGEPLSVKQMASRAHLSVSQFQREFRRLFGMTPSEYLLRVRLLMARRKLEETSDPVGTVALDCGFYDQSHFTRAFRLATGLRPLQYRRRFAPGVGA